MLCSIQSRWVNVTNAGEVRAAWMLVLLPTLRLREIVSARASSFATEVAPCARVPPNGADTAHGVQVTPRMETKIGAWQRVTSCMRDV